MNKDKLMEFADKLTFLGNEAAPSRAFDENWIYACNILKVEPLYYKLACIIMRKFCSETEIVSLEELFDPDTDEYRDEMEAAEYVHMAYDCLMRSAMEHSKYWTDNGYWNSDWYPIDEMNIEIPSREDFEKFLRGEYPLGDAGCEVENSVCTEFSNEVLEWTGCIEYLDISETEFLDILYETLELQSTPECFFRFSALISEGMKTYFEFAEKNKSLIMEKFQKEHNLLKSIVKELQMFVIADYPDTACPVCLKKGSAIIIGWLEGTYYSRQLDGLQYNMYLPYLIFISDALLDKAIDLFNLDIKPYKKTFTLAGMNVTIEE